MGGGDACATVSRVTKASRAFLCVISAIETVVEEEQEIGAKGGKHPA